MNEIAIYLAKASVGIILFYLVFWLTLKKETTFKANRVYLIASLFLSILIPLTPITYKSSIQHNTYSFTEIEKAFNPIVNSNGAYAGSTSIAWHDLIMTIYILGVALFLIRILWQSSSLLFLIYKSTLKRINNTWVVENCKYDLPFSFLNIVFINPNIHKGTDLTNILAHEKVHIREQHWLDLILIELFTIVFWFNPFVWLYERSIKQNHEYLADEGVLAQGFSIGQYQAILINQIMGMQVIGLTNNLNYSLNKKRMSMMTKTKSTKVKAFKLLWALPVIALLTMAFAKPIYKVTMNSQEEIINTNVQDGSDILIEGKVLDPNGRPLKNVSIVVYGKMAGTITDENGLFSIKMSSEDKISLSYVGYISQLVDINFIKKSELKKGAYRPVFTLEVGIIKLEIENLLKTEKPVDISKEANRKNDGDDVFVMVEELPAYPGGLYAFAKEIKDKTSKIQPTGKVAVGFTIDENGKVKNIQFLGTEKEELVKTVVKAFYELKDWTPGKQRGMAVPVNYSVAIN